MRRCSFQSVLREAAGLAGFTLERLSASPRTQFRTFLNRRTRELWQHWWWSELMHVEERGYRAPWEGLTGVGPFVPTAYYPTGSEVFHSGRYWRAGFAFPPGVPNTAEPGVSSSWVEFSPEPAIEREQIAASPIGTVRLLSVDDPRSDRLPRSLPFRLVGDAIWVLADPAPASLFVWYREPMPNYLGEDFDSTAAYTAGRVVYFSSTGLDFEGDFYTCLATTTAGQSPETNPTLWERLDYPEFLRPIAAQAAYADWLRADGRAEAARLEDAEARSLLLAAVHRDGPAQRQLLTRSGS